MPSVVAKAPKDVDSVLVRLPTRVKERIASTAQSSKISQNAFISSAILCLMLAGEVERMGHPSHIGALVRAIDASAKDSFPVMGAFHRDDWAELQHFISLLVESEIVADVRSRPDSSNPDTTVFAMSLTRVGHVAWPSISAVVLSALRAADSRIAMRFEEAEGDAVVAQLVEH